MLLLRRMATRVDVSRDPWTPLPQPHAEPPGSKPAAGRTAATEPTTMRAAATTAATTAPASPPTAATVTPATAAAPTAAPAKAARATKAAKSSAPRTWVAAEDGACPPGYPIKAKTASHIFRVPGMSGYDSTRPDRCYRSEDEALADGFTRAKR
jgi:hypothetical protein